MRVFHTTTGKAADAIEREGFRDGVGSYLKVNECRAGRGLALTAGGAAWLGAVLGFK